MRLHDSVLIGLLLVALGFFFGYVAAPDVTLSWSIPEGIWTAFIATVSALGGVVISNRSNLKRQREQLAHDAQERERERHSGLRREVYLEVVTKLTRAMASLAALPQRDVSKEEFGAEVREFGVAAAKLQLVAEQETARVASELAAHVGAISIRLMGKVLALDQLRREIRLYEANREEAQSDAGKVAQHMVEAQRAGAVNAASFQQLRETRHLLLAKAAAFAKQSAEASDRLASQTIEFLKEALAATNSTLDRQAAALAAIRHDLGLATDKDALKAQMEDQWSIVGSEANRILGRHQA